MTPWYNLLPGERFEQPFLAKMRSTPRVVAPAMVTHIAVPYKQWDGPIGPWSEHFGKGRQQIRSLDDTEPRRSCNEVEVVRVFRRAGWMAFWISCYNPGKLPSIWRPFALPPSEMPSWLHDLDRRVRRRIPHKSGGIPDVAAWLPTAPLETFVSIECKGAKEKIKENQEDWVSAAILEGLPADRVGVAVRTSRE